MKKESKVIKEFIEKARPYFDSDKEFEDFLYTPEHFWSSGDHLKDLSPYKFLTRSRRADKLDYALNLVKELKTTIIMPT